MADQQVASQGRAQQLADLFHQTAEDHHVAYAATDGVDPDWSIWYSGRLLEQGIEQLFDAKLLRSNLIYLLVLADKQQNLEAPGGRWERDYADFFLSRYRASARCRRLDGLAGTEMDTVTVAPAGAARSARRSA
jgi:hypothetical protein